MKSSSHNHNHNQTNPKPQPNPKTQPKTQTDKPTCAYKTPTTTTKEQSNLFNKFLLFVNNHLHGKNPPTTYNYNQTKPKKQPKPKTKPKTQPVGKFAHIRAVNNKQKEKNKLQP